jgi:hypothetical protein
VDSYYGWRFLATEIDDESIKWARKNVAANNLQNEIVISKVPDRLKSGWPGNRGPLLSALAAVDKDEEAKGTVAKWGKIRCANIEHSSLN